MQKAAGFINRGCIKRILLEYKTTSRLKYSSVSASSKYATLWRELKQDHAIMVAFLAHSAHYI